MACREKKNKGSGICGVMFIVTAMLFLFTACGREEKPVYLNGENVYTIVFDADAGKQVKKACKTLQQYLGSDLVLSDDEKGEIGEYEILLGVTNRPESFELAEGLGEHDYRIAVKNRKLVLAGGSDTALVNAIAALMRSDALSRTEDGDIAISGDYNIHFDGADTRSEYIENPDLFLCNWVLEFETPQWMLDFEEKIAAFNDPEGRMMSSIHRGDSINYPENSIEGIISAIKMGADNIEIDVRLTKDGVAVLMHDESLGRTTDWESKVGKNGLSESALLSEWTYEELCQLRLRSMNGQQTDYMIPTLQEVLQVCNERTTIRLDKPELWDWDSDIYPLVEDTGAWRTCILNWHFSLDKRKRIRENIKTASSKDVQMFYLFESDEYTDWPEQLNDIKEEGHIPLIRWGGFDIGYGSLFIGKAGESLQLIEDQVRIYVDAHSMNGGSESQSSFAFLYENGVDFVLVDNGMKLQKYIAENFTATEYETE